MKFTYLSPGSWHLTFAFSIQLVTSYSWNGNYTSIFHQILKAEKLNKHSYRWKSIFNKYEQVSKSLRDAIYNKSLCVNTLEKYVWHEKYCNNTNEKNRLVKKNLAATCTQTINKVNLHENEISATTMYFRCWMFDRLSNRASVTRNTISPRNDRTPTAIPRLHAGSLK